LVSRLGQLTAGNGFTVIRIVWGGPVQLVPPIVNDGVTVIVAVIGLDPLLVAMKEVISPVPFAERPIEGWLLVQLKVVTPPSLLVVNEISGDESP